MNSRMIIPGSLVAGLMAMLIPSGIVLRRWRHQFSATGNDATSSLPGDDLVAQPRYQTTRSVAIRSDPSTIWAWLVQIGAGRGGFYSFDQLENLAGMNVQNSDRIMPELQRLAVGDRVPFTPSAGPTVAAIDPERSLVLHYVMDPFSALPVDRSQPDTRRWFDWTWTFLLRPVDDTTTRLIVRTRAEFSQPLLMRPLAAVLLAPVHLLMEWRMLWGIKRRAETMASLVVRSMQS